MVDVLDHFFSLFIVTKYCSTRCLPYTAFTAIRILYVVRRPLWHAPDSIGDGADLSTVCSGPVGVAF